MSRRGDKRTGILGGILADPWRKLLSIGLALLLWYYLHAQITKQFRPSLPLLFERTANVNHVSIKLDGSRYSLKGYLDGDTREAIDSIQLEIEGPNRTIEELSEPGRLSFDLVIPESRINRGGSESPPFTVFRLEDLHHQNSSYDRLLRRMTPRNVRIELRQNRSKKVSPAARHLTLDLIEGEESLKDRLRDPEFFPPVVNLLGDEAAINAGVESRIFICTVDARLIKTQPDITLPLELSPAMVEQGLKVDPMPTVKFKIAPSRNIYVLEDVPVVLDYTLVGPEEGRNWKTVPESVTFKIQVAAASDLDSELFKFFKAGTNESQVDASWTREHAQFRVVLRDGDRATTTTIERRPTIRLFSLDVLDKETPFLQGPDYLPGDDLPIIKIERIKARKPN